MQNKKEKGKKGRRGRDDSLPVWWNYQSSMDLTIRKTRVQEPGRLRKKNVDKKNVMLWI